MVHLAAARVLLPLPPQAALRYMGQKELLAALPVAYIRLPTPTQAQEVVGVQVLLVVRVSLALVVAVVLANNLPSVVQQINMEVVVAAAQSAMTRRE
jgi:hypothetical protein